MDIIDQLIRDEGLRLRPYRDSVGKLTIGIGHNLDDKPVSKRSMVVLAEDDVADAVSDLMAHLPWVATLNDARLNALVNMTFNLGIGGLLGFKTALAAMQSSDYTAAAKAFADSKWFQQVGPRAVRLITQIQAGVMQ